MGSAAAYHLTKLGHRVLGLDRFQPPHNLGSSHGLTRIIREAYFEHPLYVPLVQRAYHLWADLEKESGQELFLQTGGLMIGPPDGVLVSGARRSAEQHKLPHELLSAPEVRRRFPALAPNETMVAVSEPRAGILFPELAIRSHLSLATKHGAIFKFNEPVVRWEPNREGVRVFTATNSYTAKNLLLAAGSWTSSLLSTPRLPLSVERQILFWFEPASSREHFQPENCPIHIWEYAPHRFFYGFPDLGGGIKVAIHHEGQITDPESICRDVSTEETETIRTLLRRFLPAADGSLKSSAVCMYTNTPDEHFILDHHPNHSQVLIFSPCSGHGFKFSPVIGELAATLLEGRVPPFDLSLFRFGRFPLPK
jgi:sarcosine oxidase